MLDFIRKSQYFEWLDSYGALRAKHASSSEYNLKDIQDHYAISRLSNSEGARILEIGGADCRVLREFSATNECWNAEKFEGLAGGPSRRIETAGVRNVSTYLGEFNAELPEDYFDVVFSISVVEHVTDAQLTNFFRDIARVLRPGGTTFHAIDLYVFDQEHWADSAAGYSRRRLEQYLSVPEAVGGELVWMRSPAVTSAPGFSCSFATNADREMYRWNRAVPVLAPIRSIAQSVSLMAEWTRPAP
jgi:SAM-dependent methyltransferase